MDKYINATRVIKVCTQKLAITNLNDTVEIAYLKNLISLFEKLQNEAPKRIEELEKELELQFSYIEILEKRLSYYAKKEITEK